MEKKEGLPIQHAGNGPEYCIEDTNYKVDGYIKKNKTVIEFLGCYWHGCPK